MSDEFKHKYVGFMILWMVIGVFGTGMVGLIYFAINGSY